MRRGRAVQIDPLKPKLKPPGTEPLKPNCDILLQLLLSNWTCAATSRVRLDSLAEAFAKEGRCSLTVSKLELKARPVLDIETKL